MGRFARGATLIGATRTFWESMNSPTLGPGYLQLMEGVLQQARAGLGDRATDEALARGAALSLAEAAAVARGDGAPATGRVPETPAEARLSPRETEVAELVAGGLTNREIARRLVIAKRTVDSHVEHILAKLGVASRTQIATWITEHRPR
ncbi:LuxR C-terminal-related transcriptional regulator [Actinomadura sp. PM05-2]|uniref:LuxR C-terminal-related transcriptional regulator n=2 Tax=Actinomadura parmotrematis TaxID=2864039 RepID=A0ABS7FYC5_9ACTN|nr:LuxR C-terminal-related transcriptional regulator [Actinomadura parmotrematis]